MTEGSNNPPDVELALTTKQAKFLLANADQNIIFALGAVQTVSETGARKLVDIMEQFKEIRELLIKQGVTNDD